MTKTKWGIIAAASTLFLTVFIIAQAQTNKENILDTPPAAGLSQAQVLALLPQPSATTPQMEAIGGEIGASTSYMRSDARMPRITRSGSCVTNSSGVCSVTWTALSVAPGVFPIPLVASSATQATMCAPVSGTITTTGATLKCFTTQNYLVSILGANVIPITTTPAGITVQYVALPPS